MLNEPLRKIWADWKNVILITVAVGITVASMWWLPPVVALFETDPSRTQNTANQISNALWWVVFILAAQMIFANRKKRAEVKHKIVAKAKASLPTEDERQDIPKG